MELDSCAVHTQRQLWRGKYVCNEILDLGDRTVVSANFQRRGELYPLIAVSLPAFPSQACFLRSADSSSTSLRLTCGRSSRQVPWWPKAGVPVAGGGGHRACGASMFGGSRGAGHPVGSCQPGTDKTRSVSPAVCAGGSPLAGCRITIELNQSLARKTKVLVAHQCFNTIVTIAGTKRHLTEATDANSAVL